MDLRSAQKPRGIVYLVHCVDTEGPLYESPSATREVFSTTYGLKADAVRAISRGEVPTELDEALLERWQEHLSRRNFNSDWSDVDRMVSELMSPAWRQQWLDDAGQAYVFSWFILDHVGFTSNPRLRTLGYHAVYDRYAEWLMGTNNDRDRLYWHFHPVSWTKEAHKAACTLASSTEHYQILSRRLIERMDFPVAFRPGQHTERPDLNLFLEQWIPFDYGSQGMPERAADAEQLDIGGGRFGDWRRAPEQWGFYHPSIWDYQVPGSMHRYVARCLNLDSRLRTITVDEINSAFLSADKGEKVLMSVTNHDERDMRPGIAWLMNEINSARHRYPDVSFLYANAVEGMRAVAGLAESDPIELQVTTEPVRGLLTVESSRDAWGGQPFLAARYGETYIHENLDRIGANRWSFTFDDMTIPWDAISAIGLAAHDMEGNTCITRLLRDEEWKPTTVFRNNGDWLD